MTTRVLSKKKTSTRRSARKASASRATSAAKTTVAGPGRSPAEPDLDAALRRVLDLLAIPGGSGHEGEVAQYITRALRAAGADARRDPHRRCAPAHAHCRRRGQSDLHPARHVRRPAHACSWPTWTPCRSASVPSRSLRETGFARPTRKRAWAPTTVPAWPSCSRPALEILRRGLPHPPLTFFWPIQEEIGPARRPMRRSATCWASRKLAFNWDGGPADKITIGATGGYRHGDRDRGPGQRTPGAAPERGHQRHRHCIAWRSPIWCAGAGTGRFTKEHDAARATWASFTAATPRTS